MRYITITWDDIEWVTDDDDSEAYDVHTGGFVMPYGWHSAHTEGMSRDQLVEFHNEAKHDLDDLTDDEKQWQEVLADIFEEYGCYEDNVLSWYSDYYTVDYRTGIDRQYAVHIEWDMTNEESFLLDEELRMRKESRKKMLDEYLKRTS
jgi:hypothetical protein